jgi:formylglycine-generating enzyme required for sulfatase activity
MDMAGNVSEWVFDYFWPGQADGSFATESGGYADLPKISPVRSAPRERITHRVVRGGSWLTPLLFARTYVRYFSPPNLRAATRGFRCARDYRAGDVGAR